MLPLKRDARRFPGGLQRTGGLEDGVQFLVNLSAFPGLLGGLLPAAGAVVGVLH